MYRSSQIDAIGRWDTPRRLCQSAEPRTSRAQHNGGATLSGFAWAMLFGIVVGTSSSIFIAAPILLLLGETRLRRDTRAAAPVRKHPA